MRLLTDAEQRKQAKGLCVSPQCSNRSKRRYCHRCHSRVCRAKFPLKAVYKALRNNAKRRGKITLSENSSKQNKYYYALLHRGLIQEV